MHPRSNFSWILSWVLELKKWLSGSSMYCEFSLGVLELKKWPPGSSIYSGAQLKVHPPPAAYVAVSIKVAKNPPSPSLPLQSPSLLQFTSLCMFHDHWVCLQSADVAVRPAGGVGESRKHSREAGVGPTGDRGGSGHGQWRMHDAG